MLRDHLKVKASELERFRQLVRNMSRQSEVYRMLRDELTALGHWKAAPRGKPDIRNITDSSPTETNYTPIDD
jgi:hypothetical protein